MPTSPRHTGGSPQRAISSSASKEYSRPQKRESLPKKSRLARKIVALIASGRPCWWIAGRERFSRGLGYYCLGVRMPIAFMAVLHLAGARLVSTVSAAVNGPILFNSVAHNVAAAVRAGRRQRMNSALERIKRVPLTTQLDRKRLVVIVSADFAFHGSILR
jgi:hypothetical protein